MQTTMNKYFSWKGKIGRLNFIISSVITLLIAGLISAGMVILVLGPILNSAQINGSDVDGPAVFAGTIILAALVCIILFYFFISFPVVKRFHDINKPSSYYWLLLIPWINIYFFLELLLQKGMSESGKSDFFDRVGRNTIAKILLSVVILAGWSYFILFRQNPASSTPQMIPSSSVASGINTLQEYDANLNSICSNPSLENTNQSDFATCAYTVILNDEMATGTLKSLAEQEQVAVDERQAELLSDSQLISTLATGLKKLDQQYSTELAMEMGADSIVYLNRNLNDPTVNAEGNALAQKLGSCWDVPEGECKN